MKLWQALLLMAGAGLIGYQMGRQDPVVVAAELKRLSEGKQQLAIPRIKLEP